MFNSAPLISGLDSTCADALRRCEEAHCRTRTATTLNCGYFKSVVYLGLCCHGDMYAIKLRRDCLDLCCDIRGCKNKVL